MPPTAYNMEPTYGMNIRTKIAAGIMAALLVDTGSGSLGNINYERIAEYAVFATDLLILALNKPSDKDDLKDVKLGLEK